MTDFFGARWDAPVVDDAIEIPTPVGQACLHCGEPILAGDRGLMRPHVSVEEGNRPVGVIAPVHMECDLRNMTGGIAHHRGRCLCHGVPEESSFSGTPREEAREVLAFFNAQRAEQGRASL